MSRTRLSVKQLIQFEKKISLLFERGKIRYPVHLSGGNEEQLIEIFKGIRKRDYVFSTHRNHYHALLHGVPSKQLLTNMTTVNEMGSMHTMDYRRKFFTSATVAGCVAIACGVALALKAQDSKDKVWCFIGDGATDEGWFHEALTYAQCQDLPITYILEDNDRSVCTSVLDRWGDITTRRYKDKVLRYSYKPKWPHVGTGKYVAF